MKETLISAEYIYKGKIVTLRKEQVLTSHGITATREIIEHAPAVVIIPMMDKDTIIMVRQYRRAVDQIFLELPAGLINLKEEPLEAAKRELVEETGFLAAKWTFLTSAYASPGFCDELMHFYLAEKLTLTTTCPDEDEVIVTKKMNFQALLKLITNGQMQDSKTIIGALLAKQHESNASF